MPREKASLNCTSLLSLQIQYIISQDGVPELIPQEYVVVTDGSQIQVGGRLPQQGFLREGEGAAMTADHSDRIIITSFLCHFIKEYYICNIKCIQKMHSYIY